MKVRISEGDCPEIEISGTAVEWLALAEAVRHDGVVVPCESGSDPQPYARFGQQMVVIHVPDQKVRFAIFNDGVEIAGDPAHLEILSQEMSGPTNSLPGGYHVHIEYQGDSHYVASGSVPAILLHLSE